MPIKKCPSCGSWNNESARYCDCGFDFSDETVLPENPLMPELRRRCGWGFIGGILVFGILLLSLSLVNFLLGNPSQVPCEWDNYPSFFDPRILRFGLLFLGDFMAGFGSSRNPAIIVFVYVVSSLPFGFVGAVIFASEKRYRILTSVYLTIALFLIYRFFTIMAYWAHGYTCWISD